MGCSQPQHASSWQVFMTILAIASPYVAVHLTVVHSLQIQRSSACPIVAVSTLMTGKVLQFKMTSIFIQAVPQVPIFCRICCIQQINKNPHYPQFSTCINFCQMPHLVLCPGVFMCVNTEGVFNTKGSCWG